jgi:hypothetical protein
LQRALAADRQGGSSAPPGDVNSLRLRRLILASSKRLLDPPIISDDLLGREQDIRNSPLFLHRHGRRPGRSVSGRVLAFHRDRIDAACFGGAAALGAKFDGKSADVLDVVRRVSRAAPTIRLVARHRNDFADRTWIAVVGIRNAHRHRDQSMIGRFEQVRAGRNARDHRRGAFGCNGDVERRFRMEPAAVGHAQGEIRGRCATRCGDVCRDVAGRINGDIGNSYAVNRRARRAVDGDGQSVFGILVIVDRCDLRI